MKNQTKLEIKVGLFVLFLSLIMILIAGYVGIKRDLFAKKIYYYLDSTSGDNLERGIPVKISGIKVGQVSNIIMHDVDKIEIEIEIFKKNMHWFREKTTANLIVEFPIGNAFLDVKPGKKDNAVLPAGSRLKFSRNLDFLSTAQKDFKPVIEEVKTIVSNIRFMTQQFLDPNEPLQTILVDIKKILENVSEGQGLLKLLVDDPEPVERIKSILEKSDNLIAILNDMTLNLSGRINEADKLKEEIAKLFSDIDGFVYVLTKIAKDLEPAASNTVVITKEVRKAVNDLAVMRNKAEQTLMLGNELLIKMGNTWPFSGKTLPEDKDDFPMP
ncbi:MAG: MCE family protein [Desulfobacteraceae bacterium]|nr:MCE family protein [Desulfobacteraceae bacterium]